MSFPLVTATASPAQSRLHVHGEVSSTFSAPVWRTIARAAGMATRGTFPFRYVVPIRARLKAGVVRFIEGVVVPALATTEGICTPLAV